MPILKIEAAQASLQGQREINEDAFAYLEGKTVSSLKYKGILAFIADGTGGTGEGREASLYIQNKIFSEFFSTPDAWSVKRSVLESLKSINAKLYEQNFGLENRKLFSTCSVLVLRGRKYHIMHIGDTRIYRIRGDEIQCLTEDHHYPGVKNQLLRAVGMDSRINLDYLTDWIEVGDKFVMTTDGIHECIAENLIINTLSSVSTLQKACDILSETAVQEGLGDNASIQILEITELPELERSDIDEKLQELRFPPYLEDDSDFEGYHIEKELFGGGMGHVYLAKENKLNQSVVVKCPNPDHEGNPIFLERFLREEWVGRRLNSPYLLKCFKPEIRREKYLFLVMEYCEGESVRQRLERYEKFNLVECVHIAKQVAKGLVVMHGQSIFHRDIKPDNIMLDEQQNAKIIDYGIVHLPELSELTQKQEMLRMMGSPCYMAPELFDETPGNAQTDIFAFGVVLYEMMTGHFPYGLIDMHSKYQNRDYIDVQKTIPDCPEWFNVLIKRCVSLKRGERYSRVDEILYFLEHPGAVKIQKKLEHIPFIEKDPVRFWRKACGLMLFIIVLLVLKMVQMASEMSG